MLRHSSVRRHRVRMYDVTRLNLIKFGFQVQQTSFAPGSGISIGIDLFIDIGISIGIDFRIDIGIPDVSLPIDSSVLGDFGRSLSRVRSFEMEMPKNLFSKN